jgi:CO dehydrogenase maturation factor
MCPEGAVLKALMQHLLLQVPDDVILDMEAGLEHMGRASARGVDAMVAVVEPGMRSVQTALRVQKLAADIGVERIFVVANKIRQPEQLERLKEKLTDQIMIGTLPYSAELARADLEGRSGEVVDPALSESLDRIGGALEQRLGSHPKAV